VLTNRHMQVQCGPVRFAVPVTPYCESVRHALFMCPRFSDIWNLLGIHEVLTQVCSLKSEGGAILEMLLHDGM
jgi:hypothetical protein